MIKLILALALSLWSIGVQAETVDVKYRGSVDLSPFQCTDTPRSSFVERVCYDKRNQYMIVRLKSTYYHYCEMPEPTFNAFVTASSMGQYSTRTSRAGARTARSTAGRTRCRPTDR